MIRFLSLSYWSVLSFSFLLVTVSAQAQHSDAEKKALKKAATDAVFFDAVKAKMQGNEKQEALLLQSFIKERPEVSAAYFDLAVLQLNNNQVTEAARNIQKALTLDKENIWYKQIYAEVLKRQNDFAKAGETYMEMGQTGTFNKPFYFEAANNFILAKQYEKALRALDSLIDLSYTDDIILQKKQEIYLQLNDVNAAAKIAQELIDRNPKEGSYWFNLAEIYNTNNQSEKALSVYETAIKKFPEDPSVQFGLANYYRKQNDSLKYDEYIAKAILNPGTDEYAQANMLQQYLAYAWTDSLRKSKAMNVAHQLILLEPQSALLQAFYGQVLARNDQQSEAAQYLKKSVEIDPSRFEIWQELMLVYLTNNQADSLLAVSKKALKYFPSNAMLYYFNGIAYLDKKDYTHAVKSCVRAIELQPEDKTEVLSDMYASLGDAYHSLNDFVNSDSAYEKALQLNPDNPSVLNNYSYYLSERSVRLHDAERMSKRSLEIRPEEATFLDTYGWILYKQGKFKEAKTYIERALKASALPDGTLYDHLGDINYKLNDVESAVQNWKIAKEKGVDNKMIDKKIQERKIYE